MCRDREVMRFIGGGNTRTREEVERSIDAFEREWDEKGFGLFAVELLKNGNFIGFTGLSEPTFLPEIMPAVEIGWRLAHKHWGQGYATEAAQAALQFGLQDLGLPTIVSVFQIENVASRRVIEKLGMRFDRRTVDPTCGREVEVFHTSTA